MLVLFLCLCHVKIEALAYANFWSKEIYQICRRVIILEANYKLEQAKGPNAQKSKNRHLFSGKDFIFLYILTSDYIKSTR
jgi:hypothetical protein